MSAIRINDTLYQVSSKSNPDTPHFLYLDNNEWVCDCKGYKYRHMCSHLSEIKKEIGQV